MVTHTSGWVNRGAAWWLRISGWSDRDMPPAYPLKATRANFIIAAINELLIFIAAKSRCQIALRESRLMMKYVTHILFQYPSSEKAKSIKLLIIVLYCDYIHLFVSHYFENKHVDFWPIMSPLSSIQWKLFERCHYYVDIIRKYYKKVKMHSINPSRS